jgi:hypothetical protein
LQKDDKLLANYPNEAEMNGRTNSGLLHVRNGKATTKEQDVRTDRNKEAVGGIGDNSTTSQHKFRSFISSAQHAVSDKVTKVQHVLSGAVSDTMAAPISAKGDTTVSDVVESAMSQASKGFTKAKHVAVDTEATLSRIILGAPMAYGLITTFTQG